MRPSRRHVHQFPVNNPPGSARCRSSKRGPPIRPIAPGDIGLGWRVAYGSGLWDTEGAGPLTLTPICQLPRAEVRTVLLKTKM